MTFESRPGGEMFGPRIVTLNPGERPRPRDNSPKGVAERLLARPSVIHIFTDGPDTVFNSTALINYLSETFGPNFAFELHGDIVAYTLSADPNKIPEAVDKLGGAKFTKIRSGSYLSLPIDDEAKRKLEEQAIDRDPSLPIREFMEGQTLGTQSLSFNHYYNLEMLRDAYASMIGNLLPPRENGLDPILVITGRGIGMIEDYRGIPHARAGFNQGRISIASTTGLIDGPSEPISFLRSLETGFLDSDDPQMHEAFLLGRGQGRRRSEVLREIFAPWMLSHEDPRINEAIKGLAISFTLLSLGEYPTVAICSTTDLSAQAPDTSRFCRLHDSHWQEELIATQLKTEAPELCDYHDELFARLQTGNIQ